jgi:hypothetical protein
MSRQQAVNCRPARGDYQIDLERLPIGKRLILAGDQIQFHRSNLQHRYAVDRVSPIARERWCAIGAYYGAGTGLWRAGAALRDGFGATRLMLVWRFHTS